MRASAVRRSGDGSCRYLMAGMVVPGLTVMAVAAIGGKTGEIHGNRRHDASYCNE